MNLKKKLPPGVILTLSWGYTQVYDLYSQTSLLAKISRECLQDHWSSGQTCSLTKMADMSVYGKKSRLSSDCTC